MKYAAALKPTPTSGNSNVSAKPSKAQEQGILPDPEQYWSGVGQGGHVLEPVRASLPINHALDSTHLRYVFCWMFCTDGSNSEERLGHQY